MKADFEAGYVQLFEQIVHSAVFEDFLDMATELLSKGYKDPRNRGWGRAPVTLTAISASRGCPARARNFGLKL
jgi:hypothetical protein